MRAAVSGGLAAVGVALAACVLLGADTDIVSLGIALFVGGLGAGLAFTVTADVILSSVPKEQAGAASAVSETAYELGAALGIALLGSVVTGIYRGFEVPSGRARRCRGRGPRFARRGGRGGGTAAGRSGARGPGLGQGRVHAGVPDGGGGGGGGAVRHGDGGVRSCSGASAWPKAPSTTDPAGGSAGASAGALPACAAVCGCRAYVLTGRGELRDQPRRIRTRTIRPQDAVHVKARTAKGWSRSSPRLTGPPGPCEGWRGRGARRAESAGRGGRATPPSPSWRTCPRTPARTTA